MAVRTQEATAVGAGLRPQAVMLTFLGNHVYGSDICVFSGSFIEVSRGVDRSLARSNRAALTGLAQARSEWWAACQRTTPLSVANPLPTGLGGR